ncbi:hypothetical protein LLG46_06795 [bacterium]|nr:hypothetical protein [bacterium]
MDEIKHIETTSLKRNLEWFDKSGIMDPADGSWGVGERIALTQNNSALEKMMRDFPNYTSCDGYLVFEHRRPDCNFEAALMFLLASEVFEDERMSAVGSNIIHYLHARSGQRNKTDETVPRGMWRWAAGQWWPLYYVDDNAWNGTLSIMIGTRYSWLNEKYALIERGVETIESLQECIQSFFDGNKPQLSGSKLSPHFMGLALMAFAHSWQISENAALRSTALEYIDKVQDKKDEFSSSEHGYYLIGSTCCAATLGDECFLKEAGASADYIVSVMSPEGAIPSEYDEAPIGKSLVDTIYTQNWCTIGLHAIWKLTGDKTYREAYERSVRLLAKIQDDTPVPHLNGCWRGMYDMKKHAWGGGDKYEGGANSIYSGWTNAPISFTFAMDILGLSLLP